MDSAGAALAGAGVLVALGAFVPHAAKEITIAKDNIKTNIFLILFCLLKKMGVVLCNSLATIKN
jgi:hypothetical protein